MEEIKKFKAKIWKIGGSLAIIVPSWVNKAYDVNKGDYVEVVLQRQNLKKESENTGLHNAPIV